MVRTVFDVMQTDAMLDSLQNFCIWYFDIDRYQKADDENI